MATVPPWACGSAHSLSLFSPQKIGSRAAVGHSLAADVCEKVWGGSCMPWVTVWTKLGAVCHAKLMLVKVFSGSIRCSDFSAGIV